MNATDIVKLNLNHLPAFNFLHYNKVYKAAKILSGINAYLLLEELNITVIKYALQRALGDLKHSSAKEKYINASVALGGTQYITTRGHTKNYSKKTTRTLQN